MSRRRTETRVAIYASAASPQNTLGADINALEHAAHERSGVVEGHFTDRPDAADHPLSRPVLEQVFADADAGRFKVILIPCLSSLADSVPACLDTLRRFTDLGLGLFSLEDGLDTTRPSSDFAPLVAALSRLETHAAAASKDRVRAGLQRARAEGTRLGRPPMAQWTKDRIVESWQRTGSMRRTSLELKIAYGSVHAVVSDYKQRHPLEKTIRLELWLRVENNSKWVRGKERSRREIEQWLLAPPQSRATCA
ncbi:MAG: recombinase family protein [Pleurocapsa sp. SU_196_0]|nr:recombinase family protein [Pleurocapsa sp. SU_196_0]